MNLLPQSNQDGIHISRYLGIQYLWIDALCIFQDVDDPSDWIKESARMRDLYKFAYVTISASQASTGKGGCFAEHQLLEARLVMGQSPPKFSNQQILTPLSARFTSDTEGSEALEEFDGLDHSNHSDHSHTPDGSTSGLECSDTSRLLPESEMTDSEADPTRQGLQDQSEKQIEPPCTSMPTPEEVVLEMLIRQHLKSQPKSKFLRAVQEEFTQTQAIRERESSASNLGNVPTDPTPRHLTDLLVWSSITVV